MKANIVATCISFRDERLIFIGYKVQLKPPIFYYPNTWQKISYENFQYSENSQYSSFDLIPFTLSDLKSFLSKALLHNLFSSGVSGSNSGTGLVVPSSAI
jgi:hypothetical protein